MDIQSIVGVLKLINRTCSDASLTGRYSNANKIIVLTFNDLLEDVLTILNDNDLKKLTVLNKLSENANMDEVGFASSVLIMLLENCELQATTDRKDNV